MIKYSSLTVLSLIHISHVTSAFTFGARHHVTTDGKPTEQELRDYLSGLGHHDVEIETIRAGIEDCYMKLAREHR